MTHYLALDLGTSALKIALFDRDGRMRALSRQPYHAQDEHEVDADRFLAALKAGIDDVTQTLGHPILAGIGLSSQTNSFLLLDEDSRPVTPIDLWTNNTAGDEADELMNRLGAENVRNAAGIDALFAGQVLPKLLKLEHRKSGALENRIRIRLLPDFVIETLTGQAVSDGSLWGLTGLYEMATGTWWPAALVASNVTTSQLPQLVRPGTRVGETTASAARLGLPPGIPAAVGSLDHLAAAVAVGNFDPGDVSESTGTVQCLVATTRERPAAAPGVIVGPHADEAMGYYRLAYSLISGYWLDQYKNREGLTDTQFRSAVDAAENVPPGCDGWTAVVGPSGDPADGPEMIRDAGCGMRDAELATQASGLKPQASVAVRAIMEAVARHLAEMLDALELPRRPSKIFALGGGAASPTWLQIKAEALGIAVHTIECPQAAALGAAMYAAVAAGQFPDLRTVQAAWHRPGPTYEPTRELG